MYKYILLFLFLFLMIFFFFLISLDYLCVVSPSLWDSLYTHLSVVRGKLICGSFLCQLVYDILLHLQPGKEKSKRKRKEKQKEKEKKEVKLCFQKLLLLWFCCFVLKIIFFKKKTKTCKLQSIAGILCLGKLLLKGIYHIFIFQAHTTIFWHALTGFFSIIM